MSNIILRDLDGDTTLDSNALRAIKGGKYWGHRYGGGYSNHGDGDSDRGDWYQPDYGSRWGGYGGCKSGYGGGYGGWPPIIINVTASANANADASSQLSA